MGYSSEKKKIAQIFDSTRPARVVAELALDNRQATRCNNVISCKYATYPEKRVIHQMMDDQHLVHRVRGILPDGLEDVLVRRPSFRGFIVWDFASGYPDFLADVSGWLREGRIRYREDITDGLENAPRELIGRLKGENFGKKIIRVSADPARRQSRTARAFGRRPRRSGLH
jgi:hypothetical protein